MNWLKESVNPEDVPVHVHVAVKDHVNVDSDVNVDFDVNGDLDGDDPALVDARLAIAAGINAAANSYRRGPLAIKQVPPLPGWQHTMPLPSVPPGPPPPHSTHALYSGRPQSRHMLGDAQKPPPGSGRNASCD